jgi:hypothetical protein
MRPPPTCDSVLLAETADNSPDDPPAAPNGMQRLTHSGVRYIIDNTLRGKLYKHTVSRRKHARCQAVNRSCPRAQSRSENCDSPFFDARTQLIYLGLVQDLLFYPKCLIKELQHGWMDLNRLVDQPWRGGRLAELVKRRHSEQKKAFATTVVLAALTTPST